MSNATSTLVRGRNISNLPQSRNVILARHSRSSFIFAFLLVSHSHLQASSIPEIVAKTKPAIVEIVAMDEKGTPTTLGTGFFVSSDGLVVTNFHVVKGATSLSAISNNGAIFLFDRVVAEPTGVDLAILKFRAKDVPFLQLGKSATAVEGQKVIVIGNPTGLTGSVSDGIISAFREERTIIQITAPISPGSSGSPVMDEDGHVIGVATLQSVEGQNLNFAIAVENVSALVHQPPEEPSGSPAPKVASNPLDEAVIYFDRGKLSLGRKEDDKAIGDFTEAIRLDPYDPHFYFTRGLAYERNDNLDKAFLDYEKAIQLDSFYQIAYVGRGNVYFDKGDLDKAISDYTNAIELLPYFADKVPIVYYNRANAYANKGNLDEALSEYSSYIQFVRDYAPAYVGRGNIYIKKGDLNAANADFATARRLTGGK
jgi:Tfp pilus assembly protein PilF